MMCLLSMAPVQLSLPCPAGVQLDWIAIFSPSPAAFVAEAMVRATVWQMWRSLVLRVAMCSPYECVSDSMLIESGERRGSECFVAVFLVPSRSHSRCWPMAATART